MNRYTAAAVSDAFKPQRTDAPSDVVVSYCGGAVAESVLAEHVTLAVAPAPDAESTV